MNEIIVQKGTVDEFTIKYTLEGNSNSKNLLLMIHGGGMDHHEQGQFIGLKDGKPEKYIGDDLKPHTKLYTMPYGNYDRVCTELEADDVDTAIVRVDLRNHGESLHNGQMDFRDVSIERMARDISCLIDYLIEKYDYENINIFGTCMGGLVSQCYVAGIGSNENVSMRNRSNVKSLVLDCSLSYRNLYTDDIDDAFNYKKCHAILEDKNFKFNKMHGVIEGYDTVCEAQKNGDIAYKVGKTGINILYIYGNGDRLILPSKSLELAKEMRSVNSNVEIREVNQNDHGFSDHCLYDPQSSDALFMTVVPYIENQIELLNSNKKQY